MGDKRILIVEDESPMALYLKMRLQKAGYTISEIAYSGEQAVDLVRETDPDLVLMDINLGAGMDGIEAAGIIYKNFKKPVVYMTAYTDMNTIRSALDTNPYGYITKPVRETELLISLQMAFSNYESNIKSHEANQKLLKEVEERKKIEKKLNQMLDTTRAILEEMPLGIVIVGRDKKIKNINRTALNMLGMDSLEKATGKDCYRFICSKDKDECPIIDSGKTMNQCETNLITNGGKNIPILKTVIPIRLDNEDVLLEAFIDIAEHKKNEERLRILFRAIEQSPSSIVITDKDANIEYVNPAFTKVTDYTFDEAIGENPRILKPKEKKSEEYKEFWDTLTGKKIWHGEFLNVKKNGEYYWEWASVGPVLNEEDEISHFVAVKEDITIRKKAEEALKISEQNLREANAMKDKLFSIIAHDLRNAFSVVLTGSYLLAEQVDNFEKEKVIKYVKNMKESAEKIDELLENLLNWSRLQMDTIKLNPAKLSLADVARLNVNLFSGYAKQKNITLNQAIREDIFAYGDYGMVNTVIRNLVHNAVKFSHPGGKVHVLSSNEDENFIEISISDTGVGIKEEHFAHLFRIDSKFKEKGTSGEIGNGLGLPLCKEFIEKNGGEIWLESEFGKGSTFKFTLPKFKERN